MTNRPEIIQYGGGKDVMLGIQFCQELAILLGVVESLNQPVPAIIPGWSVKIKHVNILKNNLMMLWIYIYIYSYIHTFPYMEISLRPR